MANRVGIELLPDLCRIVEVREKAGLFGRARSRIGETAVRTFREIPYSPSSPGRLTADLRQALRGRGAVARHARVAMWGLRSSHLGLLLPPAAAGDLEALARREARAAERSHAAAAKDPAVISDGIVVGEIREGGRREVGYVSANPDEVQARLQPLRDAGFEIDAAVTPALAHAVMVRQRGPASPDQVTAVVAVNRRATALSVLRGAVVLFSRELPWGSETERSEQAGAAYDTSTMAGRLVSELKRSLVYIKQNRQIDVSHVLICGDMPNLRSLTGPLMHELNVEVETLDGLEGLDVAHLPEPVDQFRAQIAALRPALGLAAAATLPVDLQPRGPRSAVTVTRPTERRLVVAGLVACAVVGTIWVATWYLQNDARNRAQYLRQQIARLDPEAQKEDQARQAAATRSARLAALEAFATQGARLALVLDVFRAAPYDLTMNSLTLASAPSGTWLLSVDGQARSPTTADAQASFSVFLKSASASKYLGPPTRSPEIKLRVEDSLQKRTPASPSLNLGPEELNLKDFPPNELPRDVDVVKAERIPVKDPQGRLVGYRTKLTVALPSYWRVRGWAPPDLVKAIADYNRNWDGVSPNDPYGRPPSRSGESAAQAEPPMIGTILDFALTFEVKK